MKGIDKKWITWGIIALLVLVIGGNGCSTYNGLVSLDESCEQSWAEVQNYYQRRLDLIPNLVATVKGYAEHEKETYIKVTEARAGLDSAREAASAMSGKDITDEAAMKEYTEKQAELNRALNIYVNAVKEAYPDLKANENFKDLQTQLEGTENRIATARNKYTEAVKEYNQKMRSFPSNLWAGMFGFEKRPNFSADSEAQRAPTVAF